MFKIIGVGSQIRNFFSWILNKSFHIHNTGTKDANLKTNLNDVLYLRGDRLEKVGYFGLVLWHLQ